MPIKILEINPILVNAPVLHSLKTLENFWFSTFLRGTILEHWPELNQRGHYESIIMKASQIHAFLY